MLSKNNRQEQFRKQEPKKQRFAIKKLTVGVASVLIGFTFMGLNASASADTNTTTTPAEKTANNNNAGAANGAQNKVTLPNTNDANQQTPQSEAADANKQANEDVASPASDKYIAMNENGDNNGANEASKSQDSSSNTQEVSVADLGQGNPAGLTENKAVNEEQAVTVNSFQDFSKAFMDKNVNAIKLGQNLDFSDFEKDAADSVPGGLRWNGKGEFAAGSGALIAGNRNGDGIARALVIDGAGNTLKMGNRFISLWDNNYAHGGSNWDITLKNITVDTSDTNRSMGLFHLNTSAANAKNSKITFDGVTYNAQNTTVTENNGNGGVYGNITFAGNNTINNTLPSADYSTFVAQNVDFEDNAVLNLNVTNPSVKPDAKGNMLGNNAFYIGTDNQRTATLENPSDNGNFTVGENAKINFNANTVEVDKDGNVTKDNRADSNVHNLRFMYNVNSQGGNVVLKSGSNVNLYMGDGHSVAIHAGNLQVDPTAVLNINTLQNNNKNDTRLAPVGSGASQTHDGWHWGVISLDVVDTQAGDILVNQPRTKEAVINGTVKIVRGEPGKDIYTVTPLISIGSGSSNESATFNFTVGKGATLDLQDSSNSSYDGGSMFSKSMSWLGDKSSVNFIGLVSLWGTGSKDTVLFDNPQYVNLQRIGSQIGNTLRVEGVKGNDIIVKNSATSGTPLAQWMGGNRTATPDEAWRISDLEAQSAGGDNFSNFLPAGAVAGSTGGTFFDGAGFLKKEYWGYPFDKSGGTAVMAPFLGDYKYQNGSYTGQSMSGVHGIGLTQLTNDFSWWAPRRITIGEHPSVKFLDSTQYEPETQMINKTTADNVNDLNETDLKNGIKDLLGSDNLVAQDHNTILGNDSLIDWANSSWGVDWSKTQFKDGLNTDTSKLTTSQLNMFNALKKIAAVAPATNEDGTYKPASGLSNWKVATITYTDSTADRPSVDFVFVPINVISQADMNEPKGQNLETTVGKQVNAADAITNKAGAPAVEGVKNLPADAQFSWVNEPDVTKAGVVPAIVDVKYGDGSHDYVPVNVTVKDDKGNVPSTTGEASLNDPKGKDQNTVIGTVPSAEDSIAWVDKDNKPTQPKDKDGNSITPTYTWATEPNVNTKGSHPGIVEVTYPDGTKDLVPVTVNVTNSPTGLPQSIKQGETTLPDPKDAIDWTNNGTQPDGKAPEGATYKWVSEPDTTTPGNSAGTVQITYPDGETTLVPVPFTVVGKDDKSNYNPYAQDLTLPYSPTGDGVPEAGSVVKLPEGQTAPADVQYTWNRKPDTTQPNTTQSASIFATYTDENGNKVTKTIPVVANIGSMANFYAPTGSDLNVPFKADMNSYPAKNQISFGENAPKDATTDVWAPTPVTTVIGTQPTTIKVTYADGSADYVPVNVTVEDKDAVKYEPSYKPVAAPQGETTQDPIQWDNNGKAPEGTTFTKAPTVPDWVTVDSSTGNITLKPTASTETGTYEIPVTVAYPDGSSETKTATVTVTGKGDQSHHVYYGEQSNVEFSADALTTHKTDQNNPLDATAHGFDTIVYKSDYNHETKEYGKTTTFKYDAAKKAFVGDDEKKTEISASDFTYTWQPTANGVVTPNTKWETITSGEKYPATTATTLANDEREKTQSGESLVGNSKYRYDFSLNADATTKLGLPSGYKSWVNAFYNFYGAMPKDDASLEIKASQGGVDGVEQKDKGAALGALINHKDLDDNNQGVTSYSWGTKPTFDNNGKLTNTPSVQINFTDGTTLTVPVSDAEKKNITFNNDTEKKNFTQVINFVDGKGNKLSDTSVPGTYTDSQPGSVSADDLKSAIDNALKNNSKLNGWVVDGNYPTAVNGISTANPEAITVTLKHGTKVVNPGDIQPGDKDKDAYKDMFSTVTRTINVTNPGDAKPTPTFDKANFQRAEVLDEVTGLPATDFTGDINGVHFVNGFSNWDKQSQTFAKVEVQNQTIDDKNYVAWINGQQSNEIPEVTVKPGNENLTYNVIFVPEGEKPTDAESYEPVGQDVKTTVGTVPAAKEGISNVKDLPADASYTWETQPDVSKAGTVPAVVVVTYKDGSADKVPVKVIVSNKQTDADKYTPKGQDVKTTVGNEPAAKEGISNVKDLPADASYTWETQPDVSKAGTVPAVVVVTYKDGSADEVPVNVIVSNNVTPTPDTYDQVINYVDSQGNPVATKTVSGEQGQTKDTDINAGIPDGWELVPGQDLPTTVTFGTTNPAPITVKIQHATKTTNPTDVDPTDPANADMFASAKRTIVTTDVNGKKTSFDQTVQFGRTKTVDPVSHTTSYGDWVAGKLENDGHKFVEDGTKAEFPAYAVPQVDGWTSQVDGKDSKAVAVAPVQFNNETKDPMNGATVQVSYRHGTKTINPGDKDATDDMFANPTRTIIRNVPGAKAVTDTQTVHFVRTKTVDAVTGETISFGNWTLQSGSPADWPQYDIPQIDNYVSEIAGVKTTQIPAQEGITADTENVTYVVNYTDVIKTITPGTTNPTENPDMFANPTRTIHVTNPDGTTKDIKQTVNFVRTKTIDAATNQVISYGEWQLADGSDANWAEYDVPQLANYESEVDGVKATSVAANNAVNAETADTTVNVTYVDGVKTINPGDKDATDDMAKTVSRTIIVVNPLTGKSDSTVQSVSFVRSKTVDAVTNETLSYGAWELAKGSADSWAEFTAPEFAGYVASQAKVDAQAVTADTKDATVTINYAPTDATQYAPSYPEVVTTPGKTTTTDVTYNGDKPAAGDVTYKITDGANVPSWVNVDPSTGTITTTVPADSTTQVITVPVTVTYTDGTTDQTTATIVVVAPKDHVDSPTDPKDTIKDPENLPDGTTVTWKPGEEPDPTKKGDQPTTVVVTVPGQDPIEVPTTVNYGDPTDADKYTPEGQPVKTVEGNVPDAPKGIKNMDDLPDGTTATWTNPDQVKDDVNKPGTYTETITVNYPDGSKDTVDVQVIVTTKVTPGNNDADKFNPQAQPVTVPEGGQPNAADGIKNKGDLPEGTSYDWKTPVDTTTPGDKTATIVVTYPDGSKDEVETTVHVTSQAEANEPQGQDITVDKGAKVPDAATAIKNKDDLPQGTSYEWKTAPDTNKVGKQTATVVVTYPDGSQDTVDVTITVISDADKYEPQTQPITEPTGKVPEPSQGIKNLDDLPEGTKVEWLDPAKVAQDVQNAGEHEEDVVVTYPDGSKDIVKVTINSVTPKGQDITTTEGVLPDAGDAIANKDQMPTGTTYEWLQEPDVNTPGDHTGIVQVTFPDGSTYNVTVTVHVEAPANNKGEENSNQNTGAVANTNTNVKAPATNNGSQASAKKLPQTGNNASKETAVLGLGLASLASLFGLGGLKKRDTDK